MSISGSSTTVDLQACHIFSNTADVSPDVLNFPEGFLQRPNEVTLPFASRHSFSIFRAEYADATEHATKPRPIAPMGCSLLLTCLVWLPCVLTVCKLTASYT